MPYRYLSHWGRHPERLAVPWPRSPTEVGPPRQLRQDSSTRPGEGGRSLWCGAPRSDRRRVRGGPRRPHRVDLAPGRLPLPVRLGAPLEGRPGRDHRADDRYRGTGLQCTAVAYSRGVNRRFSVPMITDPTRSLYVMGCLTKLPRRSEEHTSELQSLAYLVCRLLLEKKK